MEQSPAVLVKARYLSTVREPARQDVSAPGAAQGHQQPPKQKNPLTVASQGMKRGDNHKPPEEKQMSIFADWP